LLRSFLGLGGRRGCSGFDHAHGAVVLSESLVSDAADISFRNGISALELGKEFTSVAVIGLRFTQLDRQTLVVV